VALALGLVLALWVPIRIPETTGSPASLVSISLLWLVGGCLAFLGKPIQIQALHDALAHWLTPRGEVAAA